MKFATLKSGGRDGTLVLVSRDLKLGASLAQIAPTLQNLLDNWDELSILAEDLYTQLNLGELDGTFPLLPADLSAPLPRAYQWADSSAYVNHIELVRKSRGAEMPPSFWHEPIVYQGGSDTLLGPRDDIFCGGDDWGCDFEAEVAVITGDVPMACSREEAKSAIRLVMLVNDVSLRGLIPAELARGFGFFHGKPSSAFSPVAVTLDELGDSWDGSKVTLP
uniref:fumarylacetoacetate hydrolase family protein n=1 Tax=uncultured Caballeronia sp. TaxID=1827198 RepID=UPI0035CC1772